MRFDYSTYRVTVDHAEVRRCATGWTLTVRTDIPGGRLVAPHSITFQKNYGTGLGSDVFAHTDLRMILEAGMVEAVCGVQAVFREAEATIYLCDSIQPVQVRSGCTCAMQPERCAVHADEVAA